MVQSLNYNALQDLRMQSQTIDKAVRASVAHIYRQRPSLRRSKESPTDVNGRFEALEELNAQVVGLQKEIAQQMMDLKASISATS